MLFFSRKKKTVDVDLSWLKTDMHSHLIPGVDDGSPDLETSMHLIKGLHSLGYEKLITTPHIFWEFYPNTPEIISNGLAEVRQGLQAGGVNMAFEAAAEYFIDDHFDAELEQGKPLLPLQFKMVLVEFSMVTAPFDLQQTIFNMQIAGYQPVIAHPERYAYLIDNKEFFTTLKDAGCFFQLNLLSLTGHYGRTVKELAHYLIDQKFYNFAGTDLHHERHLELLRKLPESNYYFKLQDSGLMRNAVL